MIDKWRKAKYEKNRKRNKKELEDAIEIYDKQKGSLQAIRHSEGLAVIREYWDNEKVMAQLRLQERPADKDIVFERFLVASEFLTFIDNLLKAEASDEEKVEVLAEETD